MRGGLQRVRDRVRVGDRVGVRVRITVRIVHADLARESGGRHTVAPDQVAHLKEG